MHRIIFSDREKNVIFKTEGIMNRNILIKSIIFGFFVLFSLNKSIQAKDVSKTLTQSSQRRVIRDS